MIFGRDNDDPYYPWDLLLGFIILMTLGLGVEFPLVVAAMIGQLFWLFFKIIGSIF